MAVPFGLLVGLILAFGVAGLARRRHSHGALRIYALALVVAALIYVGFALAGRASPRSLALEGLGVALFGTTARIGLRRWPALLAFAWAAHVAWDLLHVDGAGAAYTPAVYPWVCVSFDIVIAGAVVAAMRQRPRSGAHRPHEET